MKYRELIIFALFLFGQSDGLKFEDETKNLTRFSCDLYKNLFDVHENTIVSPFSFRLLLSILYQSVVGNSEKELRDIVYLGEKEDTYNVQRQSLNLFGLTQDIKIVNKIYLKNEGTIKPNFLEIVKRLSGNIEQLDFTKKTETLQKINSWVEEQTNGLIKNLVSSDAISTDTTLFLLNTLYFKAQWKKPFPPRSVHKSPFTGFNNVTQNIKIMFSHGDYKVAKLNNIKARVLELPYTLKSNYVFWVFLPNLNSNIVHLKDALSYDVIKEASQKFIEETYDISLPQFEIESSIDGILLLKKLGIKSIFKNYESYMLEDDLPLKVDGIKQKSKIIVNTNGTEIATGTYFNFVPATIYPSFDANRPFIYLVLKADTHEPIFMGHFTKP